MRWLLREYGTTEELAWEALKFALNAGTALGGDPLSPEEVAWIEQGAAKAGRKRLEHARAMLVYNALLLRQEQWEVEDFCTLITTMTTRVREMLISRQVTSDDLPEHVLRGMLGRIDAQVQALLETRNRRERRRHEAWWRRAAPNEAGNGMPVPVAVLLVRRLAWVCKWLVDAGISCEAAPIETLKTWQLQAERYVARANAPDDQAQDPIETPPAPYSEASGTEEEEEQHDA